MTKDTLNTIRDILDKVKDACDRHYFPGCGGCPFNDSPDCEIGWPEVDWENEDWYKELKKEVECSR